MSQTKQDEQNGQNGQNEADRLAKFETMLAAVQQQYAAANAGMQQQKAAGREKSATYRQLMGNKLQLQNMLVMYRVYGLLGEE